MRESTVESFFACFFSRLDAVVFSNCFSHFFLSLSAFLSAHSVKRTMMYSLLSSSSLLYLVACTTAVVVGLDAMVQDDDDDGDVGD